MAIAVIGGIIVSTVLSLVVVPSFFLIMDDLSRLLAWVFGRFVGKKDEEEAPPEAATLVAASTPGSRDRRRWSKGSAAWRTAVDAGRRRCMWPSSAAAIAFVPGRRRPVNRIGQRSRCLARPKWSAPHRGRWHG